MDVRLAGRQKNGCEIAPLDVDGRLQQRGAVVERAAGEEALGKDDERAPSAAAARAASATSATVAGVSPCTGDSWANAIFMSTPFCGSGTRGAGPGRAQSSEKPTASKTVRTSSGSKVCA